MNIRKLHLGLAFCLVVTMAAGDVLAQKSPGYETHMEAAKNAARFVGQGSAQRVRGVPGTGAVDLSGRVNDRRRGR